MSSPSAPSDTASPRPLSHNEQRMWFLEQLEPRSRRLRIADAHLVVGTLDVDRLRAATAAVTARHAALRRAYTAERGVACAMLVDDPPIALHDTTAPNARTADVVERVLASAELELSEPPLARWTLVHLAPDRHVLVLVAHRIAADRPSLNHLWSDLGAAYAGDGHDADCVDDDGIVAAEGLYLAGGSLALDLAWWRQELADAPGPLDLHPDRIGRARAASHRVGLPGSVDRATATASLGVVLARRCDCRDLVVSVAERPVDARAEHVVGAIERPLLIRIRLADDPTFSELLARVRATIAAAVQHGRAPLDEILRDVGGDRDPALPAVAQIVLRVSRESGGEFAISGAHVRRLGPYEHQAPQELVVETARESGGMTATFRYDAGSHSSRSIARLASHVAVLARAAAEDPGRRVSKLQMTSARERRRLLGRWSTGGIGIPSEPLPTRFERRVDAAPHAPAVEFNQESLDYAELDARANRVARYLVDNGCTRGSRVALLAHRSLEFAVGTIAILKAGGASVPIDPAYPPRRIAAMLDSCRPVSILTQHALAHSVPVGVDAALLEPDAREHAANSSERLGISIRNDDVAYVLYTSGSTGAPRGVELIHCGLSNHATAVAGVYGLTSEDRVLQLSSLSFGISVEEMIPTWLAGGTVVFRPPQLALSGAEFLAWLAEREITVLDVPTSFWHEWVSDLKTLGATTPAPLRAVVVGGERALASAYADWRRVARDDVRFFNTYGSTEISVCVTSYEPTALSRETAPPDLPIGRPFPNTRVYVLDDELQPAPVGVAGELYVGGAAVTRGYLDDARATAERFVPDPFADVGGARMYRTRDRVRFVSDGSLAFVGRRDEQVKIGGFRIEPAEIEEALRAHPAVAQAAVVVREPRADDRCLVGYATSNDALTEDELRDFLRRRLPAFMVPRLLVVLDELPLTPNGKVDRAALPTPAAVDDTRAFDPPRSHLERTIAGIWADVLDVERVGRHDAFFDLGGHSLLAVELVDELRQRVSPAIDLRMLFDDATVAALARRLGESEATLDTANVEEVESVLAAIWSDVLGVCALERDASFFDVGGHSLLATRLVARARAAGLDLPVRLLYEHPTPSRLARALVTRLASEPLPSLR